jgi:hypothetical protein
MWESMRQTVRDSGGPTTDQSAECVPEAPAQDPEAVSTTPAEEPTATISSAGLTPLGANGSDSNHGRPVRICKCGATERSANDATRCRMGHPLVGFSGPALAVDAYSEAFWRDVDATCAEISRAVLRDAGYTEADVPEALRIAATGLSQATLLRDAAFTRVAIAGPLTSSGRTRRAYVVWQTAADRAERLLRLIGLARVPKPAPSIADWLSARADGQPAEHSHTRSQKEDQ